MSVRTGRERPAAMSESLDLRSQLDLPAPSAPRLGKNRQIALSDCIGIKRAVGTIRRIGTVGAPHAAIDHEMRDMNTFGCQLASRALG